VFGEEDEQDTDTCKLVKGIAWLEWQVRNPTLKKETVTHKVWIGIEIERKEVRRKKNQNDEEIILSHSMRQRVCYITIISW